MKNGILCLLALCLLAGCSLVREEWIDEAPVYCDVQVHRTLMELRGDSGHIDYTRTPRNILDGETAWNLRSVLTPEEWTAGFFPGILWYDYENSGDTMVLREAQAFTEPLGYLARQKVYDHDLGFIMIGSYLNGYRLTQDTEYKKVLLAAADSLATLFNPQVGTLLSWPRNVEMFGGHNTIMDNMLNLELLLWAADNGGSERLRDIAVSHADTTMAYHFRPDYTSYHVAVYDPETGRHLYNCTHQGAADSTMWARGQAWAIYGYTMVYEYTHEPRFLDFAQKVTDAYLQRLPDDTLIPYWDFSRSDYRDASAACIVASALIRLSELCGNVAYLDRAMTMLQTLSAPPYRCGDARPAFLQHSVGNYPAGSEIDCSINYADYYYIEALTRLKRHLK
jgi:unsaturated chondroitin disaccharide hydrolase